MAQLESLQDELWKYSWNKQSQPEDSLVVAKEDIAIPHKEQVEVTNRYYHTGGKVDLRKTARTWRTRADPFATTWDEIKLRLELMPEMTAKQIIKWLMDK